MILWLPFPLCQRELQATVNIHKVLLQSHSLDLLCTRERLLMVLIPSLLLQFLAAVQQTAFIPTIFFFNISICVWKNCLLVHYRIEEPLIRGLTAFGLGYFGGFIFCFNRILKKNILDFPDFVKHLLALQTLYGFQPLLQYLWSGTETTPINTFSVHDVLYFFFTWSVSFKYFPLCTLLLTP